MAIEERYLPHIQYVRQYGNCAPDDVFHGITYWTDAQLQDILKRHSETIGVQMVRRTATVYAINSVPRHIQFLSDNRITDVDNNLISGAVYDRDTNEVTFISDMDSTSDYYIQGLAVNLWEALAEVWAMKANQRFDDVTWRAGNNRMESSDTFKFCCQQRDYYRARTIRRYPRVSGRWSR